jgi:hypothetical protein
MTLREMTLRRRYRLGAGFGLMTLSALVMLPACAAILGIEDPPPPGEFALDGATCAEFEQMPSAACAIYDVDGCAPVFFCSDAGVPECICTGFEGGAGFDVTPIKQKDACTKGDCKDTSPCTGPECHDSQPPDAMEEVIEDEIGPADSGGPEEDTDF